MIRFIILLFLSSILTFNTTAQSQAVIDSLAQLATKEKDAYTKAKILHKLAHLSRGLDLDQSIVYAHQALSIIPKDSLRYIANVYNSLGAFHTQTNQYSLALPFLDSALSIYQQIDYKRGLTMGYSNKGALYCYTDEYDKASECIYKSIVLSEELGDQEGIAQNLNLLVTINLAQNELEIGLKNALRSLDLYSSLHDTFNMGVTSLNTGLIYSKMESTDSMLFHSNNALYFFEKVNYDEGAANVYNSLANHFSTQQKTEIAIIYLEKAMNLTISLSTKTMIQNNLANLYFLADENIGSAKLYQQNLIQARTIKSKKLIRDALKGLVKNYKVLGDFEKAFQYQEEFIVLKDSILNESKQEQIKNLEIKYETHKKEQENKLLAQENQLLEKERDIAELKAARNRQFTYSALLGLFLVMLIAFLILRDNKTKTAQKTTQIKHQLLRNQMNPHFIFNSLNAIQSFVYKNEPRAAGKYLSSFAKLVRAILENSREEYITLEKEIQWLENYLKLQLLRFENKFDYHIDIDSDIDIASTLIPPMLTQPFIENALEHGLNQIDYQGELDIVFQLTDDLLTVQIQDNGIGINTQKTKKTDHVSLATIITKERLDFLNKKSSEQINFSIKAVEPKGTVVTFSIPLKQNF